MAKITAQDVTNDFNEIVGWPYVSPGTNNDKGIDCSGAWVRCYKKHGFNIAHGSNTIYRKECSAVGKITSESDLKVGMMVFKNGFDNGEPDKYKGDGIGNMRHIGAVTQINPLVITHATSPKAKQDFGYSKCIKNGWTHWGIGNDVDLNILGDEENVTGTKYIISDTGGVRLRKTPSKTGEYICTIPYNEIVTRYEEGSTPYYKTCYDKKGITGYIDYTYAKVFNGTNATNVDNDDTPSSDGTAKIIITVDAKYAEEIKNALKDVEISYG